VRGAVLGGALGLGGGAAEAKLASAEKALAEAAGRLEKALARAKPPKPSFFKLAIFRATRASMRYFPECTEADKAYFTERGWLESPYFYPVGLSPLKRAFGALIDGMIAAMARKDARRKGKAA
jgi:hypothetical protein